MKRSFVEEIEDTSADNEQEDRTEEDRDVQEDEMECDVRMRKHQGIRRGCGKTFCFACSVEDSTRYVAPSGFERALHITR